MTDPNYPPGPPPYSQPPAPPGPPTPAPVAAPPASPPRTPLATVQLVARVLPILAYVTMGAAALSAMLVLSIDGLDGTAKFGEFLQRIALGAGLGGTVLGVGALLRHRLLERGQ